MVIKSPLSAEIESNSPTILGNPTTLTTTITPLTSIVTSPTVTYTLNYGDDSPIISGILSDSTSLIFTHTYATTGDYGVLITTSDGLSTSSALISVNVFLEKKNIFMPLIRKSKVNAAKFSAFADH